MDPVNYGGLCLRVMEMLNFLLKNGPLLFTQSVMYVHEWDGGGGSEFIKCVHPTLPPEKQRTKKWLRSGSLIFTTDIAKLC